MGRPGPLEIGLILVIILIVFGVGKLPQVGSALGKSINAFKKGAQGDGESEEKEEAKPKKVAKKKKAPAKKAPAAKETPEAVESEVAKPAAVETPAETAE
jgi:sec-independent protein translocase protein TatA